MPINATVLDAKAFVLRFRIVPHLTVYPDNRPKFSDLYLNYRSLPPLDAISTGLSSENTVGLGPVLALSRTFLTPTSVQRTRYAS